MRYYTSQLGILAALLLFLGGLLGEASAEVNGVRGQTLYVPVYSEIPYGDRDHTLELTATLSIRNIDRKAHSTLYGAVCGHVWATVSTLVQHGHSTSSSP